MIPFLKAVSRQSERNPEILENIFALGAHQNVI